MISSKTVRCRRVQAPGWVFIEDVSQEDDENYKVGDVGAVISLISQVGQ